MKHSFVRCAYASVLLLFTMSAYADIDSGFVDSAEVVSATPLYETVRIARPVEECWTERVVYREPARRSYGGALTGGIIGGVIGHQFGHGRGRRAMTLAGTLVGAAIGSENDRYRPAHAYSVRERRCEIIDQYETEERLIGYRVKYRINGQTFVTRTREHPGRRLAVRIAVEPVGDY